MAYSCIMAQTVRDMGLKYSLVGSLSELMCEKNRFGEKSRENVYPWASIKMVTVQNGLAWGGSLYSLPLYTCLNVCDCIVRPTEITLYPPNRIQRRSQWLTNSPNEIKYQFLSFTFEQQLIRPTYKIRSGHKYLNQSIFCTHASAFVRIKWNKIMNIVHTENCAIEYNMANRRKNVMCKLYWFCRWPVVTVVVILFLCPSTICLVLRLYKFEIMLQVFWKTNLWCGLARTLHHPLQPLLLLLLMQNGRSYLYLCYVNQVSWTYLNNNNSSGSGAWESPNATTQSTNSILHLSHTKDPKTVSRRSK